VWQKGVTRDRATVPSSLKIGLIPIHNPIHKKRGLTQLRWEWFAVKGYESFGHFWTAECPYVNPRCNPGIRGEVRLPEKVFVGIIESVLFIAGLSFLIRG
jgi:hypothetical protein